MFTKMAFALAFVLATASGTLAATKQQSFDPRNDVYERGIDTLYKSCAQPSKYPEYSCPGAGGL